MTETTKAPTQDLCRSVPFEVTRSEEDDRGLVMEGYAAVFNSPTLIDSREEGRFHESIRRGAFSKTIQENEPVLQFDHGSHPVIGSIPIGKIRSIREDDRGLYVKARFHDNWLTQPVRDAISEGSVSGMSFRFSVVRDEWGEGQEGTPTRELTEVRCAELGPVVFPAYRDTSVGVRSREVIAALEDADVRSEVARALLAVRGEEEPESDGTPVDDHLPSDEEREAEAPLRDEHPSDDPALQARLAQRALDDARRTKNYLTLIRKGAEKYDD